MIKLLTILAALLGMVIVLAGFSFELDKPGTGAKFLFYGGSLITISFLGRVYLTYKRED